MNAQKVIRAIRRHSKFLITSHIDLEGDALGSELALASLLSKLGKTAYIVNDDRTPSNYSFLPGVKKIYPVQNFCHKQDRRPRCLISNDDYHRLSRRTAQAIFIIDCPNRARIGRVARLIDDKKLIINIDHHIGNKNFAKINWVDPKVSSTGEMIYYLFRLTQTKLDKKDALNIYTAILTDTGSFRYSNTTSNALYICSNLLKFGIEPAKIYGRIYENNSVRDIACVTKIISRISFGANNKIAWVKIGKFEFKKMKDKPEILGKFFDFAKSIKTVKIAIIFCQLNKRLVKLGLRSKSPIDVQKVAFAFGGGGHRLASGCTIKGDIKEVEKKILKQVKRALDTTY